MRHVSQLAEVFGPRPVGSPANQAAADYIAGVFRAAGLQVEEQPYACTAWEHSATYLERSGEPLPAEANAFSLPCDVTAPIVPVCTPAELEAAEMNGKIVLFYGDLANAPLSAKSWFLKSERDDRVIQLLEAKRPAALLGPPAATDYYGQVTEDWELDLAAATIPWDAALALRQDPDRVVHLHIECRRLSAVARNIVARKTGARTERVTLMAHFDSKINTPGASDNAAGVAALLGLVEFFSQEPLVYGLEFIAFNSEEYLPIGDDEYLRRCGDSFGQIIAALNFDGIGPALGATSVTAIACSPGFQDYVLGKAKRFPGVAWVEPWPESNHSTFSFRGVPSVAFSSAGARKLAHSSADTCAQISPAKLAEAVTLAADILENLPDSPLEWARAG